MTTSAPSSSLRIAVLGAGRIGSTVAFQLVQVGHHDVTVVARPGSARFRQLRREGAIINVQGQKAGVHVVDALDEQVAYDLVIVTLLAHQAEAVLPALRRSAAECVQFMFNTFDPERLRDAVGAARCSFGMPFVQAVLDGSGRLEATIGAAGQKTIMGRQRWVDLFNAAGLPAAFEPDMLLWLRCHVPLCVAFESVSVAGKRRGGGATWKQALAAARGLHMAFALVEALGHPVYPRSKRLINQCPTRGVAILLWLLSRIRSFRDLLATGEAECVALVDAMVATAPLAGRAVRVSDLQALKPS